jgi:2-octaprenyl-6-methoxyphenol hydroxylase
MPIAPAVEIAVVGAGPAGLAAALSLGALGAEVAIVAPPYEAGRASADTRTTALLRPSIELLKNLGVWTLCEHAAACLTGVRIVDDRGGLLRAPEVLFQAAELGLESFGANVPNPALNEALHAAARSHARLSWHATARVVRAVPDPVGVRLELAEGTSLTARLAVAADGRDSILRQGAHIATRTWRYPQAAVATGVRHTRKHAGVTTELHGRAGPLAVVPLPGDASSLVWVEEPAEAARIAALADDAFCAELGARLQGLLGAISQPGPRALFPLTGLTAVQLGANRVALVGEAAHVIPPIGAQGLNLSLRDAAALAECAADARQRGDDVGGPAMLASYHRARTADVLARTISIDLLNRTLLAEFLPAQALRGLGLHLIANVVPLRQLVMRAGLGSPGPLPRLMQPGASG